MTIDLLVSASNVREVNFQFGTAAQRSSTTITTAQALAAIKATSSLSAAAKALLVVGDISIDKSHDGQL